MERFGIKSMKDGKKQEKSTGFIQSTKVELEKEKVQLKKEKLQKDIPALTNAPILEELNNSKEKDLLLPVLASQILAVEIMIGDFMGMKKELLASWQTSNDGKIYWCASIPGHKLEILDGKLVVDDILAEK